MKHFFVCSLWLLSWIARCSEWDRKDQSPDDADKMQTWWSSVHDNKWMVMLLLEVFLKIIMLRNASCIFPLPLQKYKSNKWHFVHLIHSQKNEVGSWIPVSSFLFVSAEVPFTHIFPLRLCLYAFPFPPFSSQRTTNKAKRTMERSLTALWSLLNSFFFSFFSIAM